MVSRKLVLILAVIIVIATIVVYLASKGGGWTRKGFWMAHFVETPEKVYRRSGGTFDDAAQLALQRATTRHNPTPDDHMLAATILTRNVLAQEHRPNATEDGKFAPRDVEQAQLRQNAFDRARDHYLAALRGIQAHMQAAAPVAARTAPRQQAPPQQAPPQQAPPRQAPPRQAPRQQALPPQRAGFIVDAALDFALGGMAVLLGNDPVLAAMLTTDDDFEQFFVIDIPLVQAAQQTRDELIAARTAAASQAATPAARTDAYLNLAITHTDDSQNVHDSAVNAYLREMVKRLREEKGERGLPNLDAIVRDIKSSGSAFSENRPAILKDALDVVARAREGEKTVAADVTDEESLRLVWARADHPHNKAVSGKIRQAVFDALADCWEEGISGRKIVCVGGRVSRILGALVLLDFDKKNWEVKTLEQLKNSLLELTKQICSRKAAEAAASADPKMQKVGRSYQITDSEEFKRLGPVDDAMSKSFADDVRAEAARAIDGEIAAVNERANGIIAPPVAEGMKKEALAAIV